MAYAQKPGRPSRLIDDRFGLDGSSSKKAVDGQGGTGLGTTKVESGPSVLNLPRELFREIFEEFPVVQDAYHKHVPGVSERAWTFDQNGQISNRLETIQLMMMSRSVKPSFGLDISVRIFGRDIGLVSGRVQMMKSLSRRMRFLTNTLRNLIGVGVFSGPIIESKLKSGRQIYSLERICQMTWNVSWILPLLRRIMER